MDDYDKLRVERGHQYSGKEKDNICENMALALKHHLEQIKNIPA